MTSFAPDTLFQIGFFPVTNTLFHTLIVDAILVGSSLFIFKHIKKKPDLFQNAAEYLVESFYNLTQSLASDRAKSIFPYFMTFFLLIVVSNLTGLLPGIGTVGFFKTNGSVNFISLLRGTSTDLNFTLALALISVAATHVLSVKYTGIKEYISRFLSFHPIYLFVGLLELISEVTKVVSLSFRLFGNIFAGEVTLSTISNMFAFILPLPFLTLEVIVGFVQALVFSMLTLVFMSIFTTPPHHGAEEVSH